jgi:hypothetical protein
LRRLIRFRGHCSPLGGSPRAGVPAADHRTGAQEPDAPVARSSSSRSARPSASGWPRPRAGSMASRQAGTRKLRRLRESKPLQGLARLRWITSMTRLMLSRCSVTSWRLMKSNSLSGRGQGNVFRSWTTSAWVSCEESMPMAPGIFVLPQPMSRSLLPDPACSGCVAAHLGRAPASSWEELCAC